MPFRSDGLLSLQRAMWDAVLPSLRGVAVRVDYPFIRSRFLYDAVGRRELVVTDDIETLVIADFSSEVEVPCVAEEVPTSSPRSLRGGRRMGISSFRRVLGRPIE